MSGRATGALFVVIMVVLTVSLVAFGKWRRETRLESDSGELREAYLVPAEPLSLLSIESIYFSSEDDDETVYRATSWDAATGKRLARVKEIAWRRCAAASKGLAWCSTDKEELEVVNVPSLVTKHDAAAVSAKLGQRIMNASQLDTTPQGALRVTLADGRKVDLDAETLATAPQSPSVRESPPSPRLEACSIPSSERLGLCDRAAYGPQKRVDATEGWLRLEVVTEVPGGWILVANTSLDSTVNHRRLIKVDEQFKEVGATNLSKGTSYDSVKPMWVTKDELFLVVAKSARTTFGISAKTGQEAFRIQH